MSLNFYNYLGVSKETFESQYIGTGYVDRGKHPTFPLDIYSYGRLAVHENLWDGVTSKCRGVIVNRETNEIVARPFEKFHNFGSPQAADVVLGEDAVVWEKMDGFLVIAYQWEGRWYAASKASFTSIHAKWATAELQKLPNIWPVGFTPVFEGITPDLRIVVDYGERRGLTLLALINTSTGVEGTPNTTFPWALKNGVPTPKLYHMDVQAAVNRAKNDSVLNDEGFVVTSYRDDGPPVRVKVKYEEYLRLHRIVTGVSPKRVLQALSEGDEEKVTEWLNKSTTGFASWAKKWVTRLQNEYQTIATTTAQRYAQVKSEVTRLTLDGVEEGGELDFTEFRKQMALRFNEGDTKKYSGILFAMLDKKDTRPVIWKHLRHMTAGVAPLVDAHQ